MTMKKKYSLTALVACAMLVALHVVLVRFCSITTTYIRLSFGFVPLSVAGMLFGPWYACGVGIAADLIGAFLFPSGPFWPGFTVVAGLCGLLYGMLREKPGAPDSRMKFLLRVAVVVTLVNVAMELGLNTGNLYLMYGNGVVAWIPGRIMKCVCMIPAELLVINAIHPTIRTLSRRLQK